MVRRALVCFVVALVAAVFGFGGFVGEAATPLKALTFLCLTLAAVALVTSRALPAPSAFLPHHLAPIGRLAMVRLSTGFAVAALVVALFWALVVAAEPSWLGRALALALLALTVAALVLGPGRRSADASALRP